MNKVVRTAIVPLIGRLTPPTPPAGSIREVLEHFALTFIKEVATTRRGDIVRLIVAEGPALGAKGNALDRMFGLWWMSLQTLYITGIPVAVVTPSQLQRFMTGKGRAAKPEVMAAVIKRLPGNVTCFDDADALALAAMGCQHLGYPLAPMPATHLAAMSKVDWPKLTERITHGSQT